MGTLNDTSPPDVTISIVIASGVLMPLLRYSTAAWATVILSVSFSTPLFSSASDRTYSAIRISTLPSSTDCASRMYLRPKSLTFFHIFSELSVILLATLPSRTVRKCSFWDNSIPAFIG